MRKSLYTNDPNATVLEGNDLHNKWLKGPCSYVLGCLTRVIVFRAECSNIACVECQAFLHGKSEFEFAHGILSYGFRNPRTLTSLRSRSESETMLMQVLSQIYSGILA